MLVDPIGTRVACCVPNGTRPLRHRGPTTPERRGASRVLRCAARGAHRDICYYRVARLVLHGVLIGLAGTLMYVGLTRGGPEPWHWWSRSGTAASGRNKLAAADLSVTGAATDRSAARSRSIVSWYPSQSQEISYHEVGAHRNGRGLRRGVSGPIRCICRRLRQFPRKTLAKTIL
jgi:hypothetical protein